MINILNQNLTWNFYSNFINNQPKYLKCYRKSMEKRLCQEKVFVNGVNVFVEEGRKMRLTANVHVWHQNRKNMSKSWQTLVLSEKILAVRVTRGELIIRETSGWILMWNLWIKIVCTKFMPKSLPNDHLQRRWRKTALNFCNEWTKIKNSWTRPSLRMKVPFPSVKLKKGCRVCDRNLRSHEAARKLTRQNQKSIKCWFM
jgi:hypothetical protein